MNYDGFVRPSTELIDILKMVIFDGPARNKSAIKWIWFMIFIVAIETHFWFKVLRNHATHTSVALCTDIRLTWKVTTKWVANEMKSIRFVAYTQYNHNFVNSITTQIAKVKSFLPKGTRQLAQRARSFHAQPRKCICICSAECSEALRAFLFTLRICFLSSSFSLHDTTHGNEWADERAVGWRASRAKQFMNFAWMKGCSCAWHGS